MKRFSHWDEQKVIIASFVTCGLAGDKKPHWSIARRRPSFVLYAACFCCPQFVKLPPGALCYGRHTAALFLGGK